MANLTQQIETQLERISALNGISDITITQIDKSTIYCKATKFGKYEEKFTVERTPTGKVKKGSVRFYA